LSSRDLIQGWSSFAGRERVSTDPGRCFLSAAQVYRKKASEALGGWSEFWFAERGRVNLRIIDGVRIVCWAVGGKRPPILFFSNILDQRGFAVLRALEAGVLCAEGIDLLASGGYSLHNEGRQQSLSWLFRGRCIRSRRWLSTYAAQKPAKSSACAGRRIYGLHPLLQSSNSLDCHYGPRRAYGPLTGPPCAFQISSVESRLILASSPGCSYRVVGGKAVTGRYRYRPLWGSFLGIYAALGDWCNCLRGGLVEVVTWHLFILAIAKLRARRDRLNRRGARSSVGACR